MDSRERLAAIVREARKINTTLFADKGEGPKELLAKMGEMSVAQITDAILSSDWLRDTLAAERERCAKAWQLISEVPPPHNEVVLLFWRDWRGAEYVEATRYSTGERLPNGYSNYSEHGWATHWMPLAPPPEESRP